MRRLADYLGLGLVGGALLGGVALALVAYRLAPPSAEAPPAAPPRAGADMAALMGGDRDRGRVAFRSQCQECHTQGRQSFAPEARGRLTVLRTRIREGTAEMPAFPTEQLGDDALLHVLAYISTPAEPEPRPTPEPRIRGIKAQILEATGRPGEAPTVSFRVEDDRGTAIPPSELAALNVTVAGPTVDYGWVRREDARRAQSLPDGSARYTLSVALPSDAAGTYGAALEAAFEHPAGVAGPQPYREIAYNPVAYFPVTDPTVVPRRTVVRTESCNECHGTLATHGGTRRNTEFCVMCHNATQTDEDKRRTAGGPQPPEPVLFRNLIHRVHTGEDVHRDFVIFGGSPANPQPIDLATIHPFPRDRANCAVCHDPHSFNISRALEAESPMTISSAGQTVRQVPPVTAACVGCHDNARTAAHVESQTTAQGVETCATCHGTGRPFAVRAVHRIAEP